eukprot:GGOE01062419.1.p4 GENE.GGOE01062419.1~~GGOE01062419.1.p4  ORF type:complete len:122 (+),score=1.87 GGOE01062419.1:563-928(+)
MVRQNRRGKPLSFLHSRGHLFRERETLPLDQREPHPIATTWEPGLPKAAVKTIQCRCTGVLHLIFPTALGRGFHACPASPWQCVSWPTAPLLCRLMASDGHRPFSPHTLRRRRFPPSSLQH